METGKRITEQEAKGMTRRNVLAGIGATVFTAGTVDLLAFTGPLERKEREVANKFPNLNKRIIKDAKAKIEAEEKKAQEEKRESDENTIKYSKGVVKDAKRRDAILAELRLVPSGVRKVIDYGVMAVGAVAAMPKILNNYIDTDSDI